MVLQSSSVPLCIDDSFTLRKDINKMKIRWQEHFSVLVVVETPFNKLTGSLHFDSHRSYDKDEPKCQPASRIHFWDEREKKMKGP